MKGAGKLARNLNNKILETVIACEVEAKWIGAKFETDPLFVGFVKSNRYKRKLINS